MMSNGAAHLCDGPAEFKISDNHQAKRARISRRRARAGARRQGQSRCHRIIGALLCDPQVENHDYPRSYFAAKDHRIGRIVIRTTPDASAGTLRHHTASKGSASFWLCWTTISELSLWVDSSANFTRDAVDHRSKRRGHCNR